MRQKLLNRETVWIYTILWKGFLSIFRWEGYNSLFLKPITIRWWKNLLKVKLQRSIELSQITDFQQILTLSKFMQRYKLSQALKMILHFNNWIAQLISGKRYVQTLTDKQSSVTFQDCLIVISTEDNQQLGSPLNKYYFLTPPLVWLWLF